MKAPVRTMENPRANTREEQCTKYRERRRALGRRRRRRRRERRRALGRRREGVETQTPDPGGPPVR